VAHVSQAVLCSLLFVLAVLAVGVRTYVSFLFTYSLPGIGKSLLVVNARMIPLA